MSAAERGYGARWARYRAWYFSFAGNVLCGVDGCNQPACQLDHVEAVSGPDDPAFFDPRNTSGLCHAHHSLKTAIVDGGFGNRRTARGEIMLRQLKQTAAVRAAAMEALDAGRM